MQEPSNSIVPPNIVCREILESDLEAVADLESRGFEGRSREYWLCGLNRERVRSIPSGYPRYGFMLESKGRVVGALLLFYTRSVSDSNSTVFCNVGSWFVEKAFRGSGPRLVREAIKHVDVVYTDTTPAVSTYSFVERIGFKRYCNGLFFSFAFLSRKIPGAHFDIILGGDAIDSGLPPDELELLRDHARYGCISIVCRLPGRPPEPFIFLPFRMRRGKIGLPAMRLIYCRSLEIYKRFECCFGLHFLKIGKPIIILDANAAIEGLLGFYTQKRGRKYFRGPRAPSLTDLTYTEMVLFGP